MERKLKSTMVYLYSALMVKLIEEVKENTEAGNVDGYYIPYSLTAKVNTMLTDSLTDNIEALTNIMISVFDDNVYRHVLNGKPCEYIAFNTSIESDDVLDRIYYLIEKLTSGEYNPTLHELLVNYGGLLTPLASDIVSDLLVAGWKPLEEHQRLWNEAGFSDRPCCVSHDVCEHSVQSDASNARGMVC